MIYSLLACLLARVQAPMSAPACLISITFCLSSQALSAKLPYHLAPVHVQRASFYSRQHPLLLQLTWAFNIDFGLSITGFTSYFLVGLDF